MTKAEWLACTDPRTMLDFLRTKKKFSERKARLIAVACCRRIWPLITHERSREAVEVAECYAEGNATAEHLHDAYLAASQTGNEVTYGATAHTGKPDSAAAHAAFCSAHDAEAMAWAVVCCGFAVWNQSARTPAIADEQMAKEGFAQADLLRDVMGNLFLRRKPSLALPCCT